MEQSDFAPLDRQLLEQLPFGLLTMNADGTIASVNAVAATLVDMPADELPGKRIAALPSAAQAILGSEPKLFHDEDHQRWLQRESYRGQRDVSLLLIIDVTEQEKLAEENTRLRQQVEDLRLTDELTGLPNRRAISQALDLHVSRSRRYQNPLSVALVSVNLNKLASVRPLSSDPTALAVSRFLRDRLRWVDQIGRFDDDVFLLVLPETDQQDARGLLDKIRGEQDSMRLPDPFEDLRPQLDFGLACWTKGDDVRTLLRKVDKDLRESGSA